MSNPFTRLFAITIFVCGLAGCGETDLSAELKSKRNSAVPNKQKKESQKEIAESTNKLVEALREKQQQDEADTLEVDKERIAAEAKALEEMIVEIIHEGNADAESQTIKRVRDREIWIDKENRQVIVGAKVCLRQGPLEMFVTPMGAKAHETVLTTNCWASQIHFCLALCGIMPGEPVKFDPEYKPAHGPKVDMDIVWKEGNEIKRVRAQDMIRNAKTQKTLETHWVFGGSIAAEGEGYYADGGPLVCVSNFGVAMMDIPIKSGDSDFALLYEANTEKIPEINTQVFIYFKPQVEEKDVADEKAIAAEVQRLSKATPLDQ